MKDKKKRIREHRQNHTRKGKKTPATGDNTIDASKKDLKIRRDTNKDTYYNCNKKSHYTRTYIKSEKK